MRTASSFMEIPSLFRPLLFGLVAGVIAASVAAVFVAPVNHDYTASITRVTEAGRIETFQINERDDLLLTASTDVLPVTDSPFVQLPANRAQTPASFRFYKLRNTDDKVIGLASHAQTAEADDWMLYFAARGAMFLTEESVEVAAENVVDETTSAVVEAQETESVADMLQGRIIAGSDTIAGQAGSYTLSRRGVGTDSPSIEIVTAMQQEQR